MRLGVTCPDTWLARPARPLNRLLTTTGTMLRGAMHDCFGREATKGLDGPWGRDERVKRRSIRSRRPSEKLRDLHELLRPLLWADRVVVEVLAADGRWVPLGPEVIPRKRRPTAKEKAERVRG